MKFNLKVIAAAAALMAAASAHADLIDGTAGNSSFALVAFNTVTNAYYVRDLGTTLNAFLPNSVTTASGDGAVTGNKTPEAGFHMTWATDANWSSFLGTSPTSQIAWTVAADDGVSTAGTSNVARLLVALSQAPASTITNNTVRGSASTANGVTALASQNNPMGGSAIGSTVLGAVQSNNAFGANTLGVLDVASSLFYYAATTGTGSSTVAATFAAFANSANTAMLTLASSGLLTYDLQPATQSAVPIPAAVWLFGSGLAGLGGMVRRRKAAAAAVAV